MFCRTEERGADQVSTGLNCHHYSPSHEKIHLTQQSETASDGRQLAKER